MRYANKVLWIVAAVVICGCLPIELSVSPQGQMVIPRAEGFCVVDLDKASAEVMYSPTGQPAFAVYSPKGDRVLTIAQTSSGMGSSFQIQILTVADRKAKDLVSASNVTYARWSPDGKLVSLTRVANQSVKPLDTNLPELLIVNTNDRSKKKIASNVARLHRWFSDSRHILTFQILAKEEQGSTYTGRLVKLNVTTGDATTLAEVVSTDKVFFDLSPDDAQVLFTARGAGKPGQKLTADEDEMKLFQLDIASGALRVIKSKVRYAIYSPKGSRVLVGTSTNKDTVQLSVGDREAANLVPIASGAAGGVSQNMSSTEIYPGWVNEDTVHYLRTQAVYGTAGKALQLMIVGADGKNRRNLQGAIAVSLQKK